MSQEDEPVEKIPLEVECNGMFERVVRGNS